MLNYNFCYFQRRKREEKALGKRGEIERQKREEGRKKERRAIPERKRDRGVICKGNTVSIWKEHRDYTNVYLVDSVTILMIIWQLSKQTEIWLKNNNCRRVIKAKDFLLWSSICKTIHRARYFIWIWQPHLPVRLSDATLSSPRLRDARDRLETEKTRGREPGCGIQNQHERRPTLHKTHRNEPVQGCLFTPVHSSQWHY